MIFLKLYFRKTFPVGKGRDSGASRRCFLSSRHRGSCAHRHVCLQQKGWTTQEVQWAEIWYVLWYVRNYSFTMPTSNAATCRPKLGRSWSCLAARLHAYFRHDMTFAVFRSSLLVYASTSTSQKCCPSKCIRATGVLNFIFMLYCPFNLYVVLWQFASYKILISLLEIPKRKSIASYAIW